MFQGECTVNLNNLFSKPSTPILNWTNPRQSFLGNYDYASHFTYDNSSVSVRFHFLDLHLPSSASVWSVLFGFRPLFFNFLVYGFLGGKNGSVGRKKIKNNFFSKGPIMSSCRKKLPVHGNSIKKWCFKKLLNTLDIIKVVTQNYSNISKRFNKIQRKYLKELSSRFCVIKLK